MLPKMDSKHIGEKGRTYVRMDDVKFVHSFEMVTTTHDSAHDQDVMVFPQRFRLAVSIEGGGSGRVESTQAGIYCPDQCENAYIQGQDVELTAIPDPGSFFVKWSGDCSGRNPRLPLALIADVTCTATYDPIPIYTLTVEIKGSGNGQVVYDSGETFCGINETRCSMLFEDGTVVTLFLIPEPDSYVFVTGCRGDGYNRNFFGQSIRIRVDTDLECRVVFGQAEGDGV